MSPWLRRHPLAVYLPLQALLGFFHLGMLSPWMDEAGTLLTMHRPLGEVIAFAARDVHPPLFYLLLYGWLQVPLGLKWEVQARVLAVIFALLATAALDRLWAKFMPDRLRWWLLMLWSLSPCLLLYSRMSRSYSLQVLLIVVGAAYLLRLADRPSWAHGAIFLATALATLYTHYVPGLALLAAANLVLAYRKLWGPLFAMDVVIAAGYAPWVARLSTSLTSWGSHAGGYAVTGNAWFDLPVKLAYWAMAFVEGEAVPDVLVLLGVATLAVALWLIGDGVRQYPRTALVGGVLTVIGMIGVMRWVSYPFVPARMLFVLPFFLMLVVAGAGVHRRTGNFVLGAMLVLSVSGAVCYFFKLGFRNKDYPMPLAQIAAYIKANSTAGDSVIVVDSANSDPTGLEYALGPDRPFLSSAAAGSRDALSSRLVNHRVRTVWFLRNTHDISADGVNEQMEAELRKSMKPAVLYYQPYSVLERGLMHGLGMREPPWYAQELLEFRR